jgi:hypothetical protein
MFGRLPVKNLDLLLETPSEKFDNVDDFAAMLQARIRRAHEIVSDELNCAFARGKKHYDRRVREACFEPGEFVYFYCPRSKPRRNRKWQLWTTGPHLLIGKLSDVNFRMQYDIAGSRKFVVNIDRLTHFQGDPGEEWHEARHRWQMAESTKAIAPLSPARRRLFDDAVNSSDAAPDSCNSTTRVLTPLSHMVNRQS